MKNILSLDLFYKRPFGLIITGSYKNLRLNRSNSKRGGKKFRYPTIFNSKTKKIVSILERSGIKANIFRGT